MSALEARQYVKRDAEGKLLLVLSDGVYLYLHELFLDGLQHALVIVKKTAESSFGGQPAKGSSRPPR